MTDRPLLFTASMVRALLDGRKTQTRRLLKMSGYKDFSDFCRSNTEGYDWQFRRADKCWVDLRHDELLARLPWQAGDRIWVKETHAYVGSARWLIYRASGYEQECQRHGFDQPYPDESVVTWKPSIFMQRKASRLTLTVTDVRVERLQDISQADAMAEGAQRVDVPDSTPLPAGVQANNTYKTGYAVLWDSINGAGAWEENPWVVALTFDVRRGSIDQ